MRPQAEKQVKMRLALETIAKLENLVATDAERVGELLVNFGVGSLFVSLGKFCLNIRFIFIQRVKFGKPAVFKCKLNSLKVEELPALDDEFAKDVSEFDTLDEYKADVKAKLSREKRKGLPTPKLTSSSPTR